MIAEVLAVALLVNLLVLWVAIGGNRDIVAENQWLRAERDEARRERDEARRLVHPSTRPLRGSLSQFDLPQIERGRQAAAADLDEYREHGGRA